MYWQKNVSQMITESIKRRFRSNHLSWLWWIAPHFLIGVRCLAEPSGLLIIVAPLVFPIAPYWHRPNSPRHRDGGGHGDRDDNAACGLNLFVTVGRWRYDDERSKSRTAGGWRDVLILDYRNVALGINMVTNHLDGTEIYNQIAVRFM